LKRLFDSRTLTDFVAFGIAVGCLAGNDYAMEMFAICPMAAAAAQATRSIPFIPQ